LRSPLLEPYAKPQASEPLALADDFGTFVLTANILGCAWPSLPSFKNGPEPIFVTLATSHPNRPSALNESIFDTLMSSIAYFGTASGFVKSSRYPL
jgi:hypothetical protein